MMDAEWNVGGGLHEDDADVWVDCISGVERPLPAGYLFNGNSMIVLASKDMAVSDFENDSFSVEYVFSLYDSNTYRECLFEAKTENSSFRYKAASQVQDFWNHGYYTRNLFARNGNIGIKHHIASTWQDIFADNPSDRIGNDFLDGAFVGGGNLEVLPTKTLGGFRIGRGAFTTYQTVYAIRIYSRPLSEEEIAYNNSIDQVRFAI
jgi:hypothetical protein